MNNTIHVLVVDDSEFFGTLVAGELSRQYGMETTRTTSAKDALELLDSTQFDCIVSDYDMPGMDGIELFEAVRDRGSDISFFLLTAAGSEEVASNAITAGVTDYFQKTNDEDQFDILGRRIEAVVSRRRAQRDIERQRELNETFWDITQALMHAPTVTDILDRVVTELSSLERVHHCWIRPNQRVSVATLVQANETGDRSREVYEPAIESACDGNWPGETAAETRERCVKTLDTEASGQLSIIGVPLLYRGERYGALSLVTPADTFSDGELESLEHLGTTVGHALAAVALQREITRFREAVEQADPAILLTDTDGTIEYANTAFTEITGYSLEEVLGSDLSLLATERWDESYYERLWERAAAGEQIRDEVVQRRKDGIQFHANLSVAPLEADTPEAEGYVVIESDITELKSREQRLQVLNRVIRHNLRNDLNAATGYLSLVQDAAESETVEAYAKRAQRTVDKLLTVGEKAQFANKVVNASDREEAIAVPVAETIEAAIKTMRNRHPEATFETELQDGLTIQGAYFHPAVAELLSNAVEHNDAEQPYVHVRATTDESHAETIDIVIADNGPGIPALEQQTLSTGRETPLEHGSSLGLWLVKWIVTHAGGELQFGESEFGGSRVTISWPLASAENETAVEQ